jgi:hypothetical protein
VPNLLLHTDLPELAASLAPRRVILGGTVNGAGQTLTSPDVRQQYGAPHIELLATAAWDEASIRRLLR